MKRNKDGRFAKGNKGFWKDKERDAETNKKISESLQGRFCKEEHSQWKGGRYKTNGYIFVMMKDHPRAISRAYVFEHILVAEKEIGRYLKDNECVHHINGIRDDNRIENLVVLTKSDHAKVHNKDRKQGKDGKFIKMD